MAKDTNQPLPYGHQWIDEADIAAVAKVLSGDWLTTGPTVDAFEQAAAKVAGARYGVAVSSGTAALHCACQAAGLGEGDEAAVPVLTFAATANAVRLAGAEVRFTDVDPESWTMSAATLAPVLTKKTKSVLGVDFAGQPCDWDDLVDCISGEDVITIDDAAHALGGIYKGRPVGSLADMTCFSFHPVKEITTAEGGLTVADSETVAADLKRLRNHNMIRTGSDFTAPEEAFEDGDQTGEPATWYYEIHQPGFNYRISDVQCALGLSQLRRLPDFIDRRTEIATLYSEAFADTDLLKTPVVAQDRKSAWHLYVIRLNLDALLVGRRKVFDELRFRGLGVQVHYIPLHLQPYYRQRYGHKRGDFPVAEAYYDEAITLPLFPAMKNEDIARVTETVLDVLTAVKR